MRIVHEKKFSKEYKKLPEYMKITFKKKFQLFLLDEFHPLLHNHKSNPPYEGYRSIDITGDFRLIYEKLEDGYGLVRIGTHPQLYG